MNKKTCIDLYSGIGGWTLGMKLNNIEHIKSFEWNKESNRTHNYNFGTSTEEIDIRKLNFDDLPAVGSVDFVVGSPPCTQFSYANKGGGGNIEDGLIDMYQFLKVVQYLKPKYWAMENVPRVKNILKTILDTNPQFMGFKEMFNYIDVVDCSQYGTPQKRMRMIAGNFPFELFESYRNKIKPNTLGSVIEALDSKIIIDPTYKYELDPEELTDHILEENLHFEELRINKESKTHHPIYNGMSFPELLNRPSRTITSTCTRVSRESLVIESKDGYRRLTVRERATLMGFPITYQFYGNSFNSKLKMIGNAIPPVLTYYIFQSMLEIQPKKLKLIDEVKSYKHKAPLEPIPVTPPDKVKFRYRESRSFRLAIPEFRFGSGVRFELSNEFTKDACKWSIRFYYGTSKRIMEVTINKELFDSLQVILKRQKIDIKPEIKSLEIYGKGISSESLQKRWVHENQEGLHPFEVLDMVSSLGLQIKEKIDNIEFSDLDFELLIGKNLNNKLFDNKSLIVAGLITGYVINKNIKL